MHISKLKLLVVIFTLIDAPVFGQLSDSSKAILLTEIKVNDKRKHKALVFSSFEKKIHISLNPHHDEFRYSFINRRPDRFVAASFTHNDTSNIFINKIEGRVKSFDTSIVKVRVVVIQRNKVLFEVQLLPTQIENSQFSLLIDDIKLVTGEFYVLYVCDFVNPGQFFVVVSPKKESKEFSFGTQNVELPNSKIQRWKLPAPQFKIYCNQF